MYRSFTTNLMVLAFAMALVGCSDSNTNHTGGNDESLENEVSVNNQEEIELENFLSFIMDKTFECVGILEGHAPEFVEAKVKFTKDNIIWNVGGEEQYIPYQVDFVIQDYNGVLFAGVLTAEKEGGDEKESIVVIDDSLVTLSWYAESIKLGLSQIFIGD